MTHLPAESPAHESLFRVPVSPLVEGELILDRATSHYVVDVHRAGEGAQFVAFDASTATQALTTVVQPSSRAARCRVGTVEPSRAVPQRPLVVIQAFGKGSRIDDVVRDATALDATEIWVVATSRSSVPSPTEMRGRVERWRKIAVEAARQCQRGDVPRIEGVVAMTAVLQALSQRDLTKCVLWPKAGQPLLQVLARSTCAGVAMLIGPEGGLIDAEVDAARECGFQAVQLGPRILRTEVATTVALGAAMAHWDQTRTKSGS